MKNANDEDTILTNEQNDAECTLDQAVDTLEQLIDKGIDEDNLFNGLQEEAEELGHTIDTTLLTLEKFKADPRVQAAVDQLLNNIIGAYQMAEDDF